MLLAFAVSLSVNLITTNDSVDWIVLEGERISSPLEQQQLQLQTMDRLAHLRTKIWKKEHRKAPSSGPYPRFLQSTNDEPWKHVGDQHASWKEKLGKLRERLKRFETESKLHWNTSDAPMRRREDDFIPRAELEEPKPINPEALQKELGLAMRDALRNYKGKIPTNCRGKVLLLKIYLLSQQTIPDDLCDKLPLAKNVNDMFGRTPVFVKDCGSIAAGGGGGGKAVLLEPQISSIPNGGVGLLKRLMAWNIPGLDHVVQHGNLELNTAIARRESIRRPDLEAYAPPPSDSEYLRIIVVKDPYFWMQSICFGRNGFGSAPEFFDYAPLTSKRIRGLQVQLESEPDECPYLVTPVNREGQYATMPLFVRSFAQNGQSKTDNFDSLPAYWNKWISGFVLDKEPLDSEATAPYIVIRYEDLLFHPDRVIREVSQCSGHESKDTFEFKALSSRELERFDRNPTSGLLDKAIQFALPLYSNQTERIRGLSDLDLFFTQKRLDSRLLDLFQYRIPRPTEGEEEQEDREW